jgi:ATP-dependent Clp protease ATP-binding subunit ClpB
MNLDRFTQKAQEAILHPSRSLEKNNNPSIEPVHLLLALIQQEEGVVPAIITKVAGSTSALRAELQQALEKMPRVIGAGISDVGLGRTTANLLDAAERYAKGMQDDYVSSSTFCLLSRKAQKENDCRSMA